MKLLIKIVFIIIFIFSFHNTQWFMCESTWYKKNFFEKKVYAGNTCGWDYEITWADYSSFKFWDWYAHDKKSIYTWGSFNQDRLILDDTYSEFYKNIIYIKNENVYYKNKYDDLIKITTKSDNLKVLYSTPNYVWLRSNDIFFNIDTSQYWFNNKARRLDIESWCNISSLEFENWIYFDGTNVCWYAFPVPKKLIETLNKKILLKLEDLNRWEILDIHNIAYKKRWELYDSTFRTNSTILFDRYLLVSMEHVLQYIKCDNYWEKKNYIGCVDLHRRQLLYP